MLCFEPHILSQYYTPGQELHCSGILKTLFSFFKALHRRNKFVFFLVSEFADLGGDAGGCSFFCEGFGDNASSFRSIRGFCCTGVCLFTWAVSCNVTLFIAFEAAAFFPIFFFICFGDGFSSSCTSVHRVWVPRGELLYQRSSRILGSLVLLLLSPTSSLKEGVMGSILCQGWSGHSGPIFRSFKALNQNVVSLLHLGCFRPLFKAFWLF